MLGLKLSKVSYMNFSFMKVAIYNTIGFLFGEYRKRIIGGP